MYEAWHTSVPFADQAEDVRAEYDGAAAAVLDALTATGRLIDRPPGCACPSAGLMAQPGCPAHAYRGGTDEH